MLYAYIYILCKIHFFTCSTGIRNLREQAVQDGIEEKERQQAVKAIRALRSPSQETRTVPVQIAQDQPGPSTQAQTSENIPSSSTSTSKSTSPSSSTPVCFLCHVYSLYLYICHISHVRCHFFSYCNCSVRNDY